MIESRIVLRVQRLAKEHGNRSSALRARLDASGGVTMIPPVKLRIHPLACNRDLDDNINLRIESHK
ncbi:MAG: hypothetical protein EPN62_12115 [Candidimonas sp.]|nr:MAG: hypothetical protein EPN62_12115 [Candidimonas sp.]